LLTCARTGAGRAPDRPRGHPRGAVAAHDGRIVWVGRTESCGGGPPDRVGRRSRRRRVVMPGLVECHAHLAFAGDSPTSSSCEWRDALPGGAAAGGGIMSTSTRRAPLQTRYSAPSRANAGLLPSVRRHHRRGEERLRLSQEQNCAYSRSIGMSAPLMPSMWYRRCWPRTPCRWSISTA